MNNTNSAAFDKEVMYKLGAIENQMKALGEQVVEAVRRLEEKIDDSHANHDEKYKSLEKRVDLNERRLNIVDTWRQQQMARMTVIAAVAGFLWMLFDDVVVKGLGVFG